MLSHGEKHDAVNEVAVASPCGDLRHRQHGRANSSPPSASHRARWTPRGHSDPPLAPVPHRWRVCVLRGAPGGTAPNALCHTDSKLLPEERAQVKQIFSITL